GPSLPASSSLLCGRHSRIGSYTTDRTSKGLLPTSQPSECLGLCTKLRTECSPHLHHRTTVSPGPLFSPRHLPRLDQPRPSLRLSRSIAPASPGPWSAGPCRSSKPASPSRPSARVGRCLAPSG